MAIDANQILADVVSAVAEVGRTVTLTDYVDTYSTATGKNTRVATDYTVQASPPYSQDRSFGGDSQPSGSVQMVVPASGLTVTLRPGQSITFDSRVYMITGVVRLEIGSTLLAYECTLSQGGPA